MHEFHAVKLKKLSAVTMLKDRDCKATNEPVHSPMISVQRVEGLKSKVQQTRRGPAQWILQYLWANYNISLTWIKAIWGWFPLLTIIYGEVLVRSLWFTQHLQGHWALRSEFAGRSWLSDAPPTPGQVPTHLSWFHPWCPAAPQPPFQVIFDSRVSGLITGQSSRTDSLKWMIWKNMFISNKHNISRIEIIDMSPDPSITQKKWNKMKHIKQKPGRPMLQKGTFCTFRTGEAANTLFFLAKKNGGLTWFNPSLWPTKMMCLLVSRRITCFDRKKINQTWWCHFGMTPKWGGNITRFAIEPRRKEVNLEHHRLKPVFAAGVDEMLDSSNTIV